MITGPRKNGIDENKTIKYDLNRFKVNGKNRINDKRGSATKFCLPQIDNPYAKPPSSRPPNGIVSFSSLRTESMIAKLPRREKNIALTSVKARHVITPVIGVASQDAARAKPAFVYKKSMLLSHILLNISTRK
jgi:hypothetical protein